MGRVITRFAPSPTGMLHIGNSRTALINWLYTRKHNGLFILRFDDTDFERSKQQYKNAIEQDLKFLGLNWDQTFCQSNRLAKYEAVKTLLLQKNRLYPCFETQEELELKRKLQLSRGLPPIYDRAALNLTQQQINDYISQGRKPHYRFLVSHTPIIWQDMIKGEVKYDGKNLGDPIVIREDNSMTYMLCSVIDDIDYSITHIIRGEDHVTNTAIQLQMFEALQGVLYSHQKSIYSNDLENWNGKQGESERSVYKVREYANTLQFSEANSSKQKSIPNFAHLGLVISRDDKISKRIGGFEIAALRDEIGLEPMAINSFFSLIGSSSSIASFKNLDQLIKEFDINNFSKSPTTYLPEELERLNHKLLISLSFDEVKDRLREIKAEQVTEQFWLAVRANLQKLYEIKDWWNICYSPSKVEGLDKDFLKQAAILLPDDPITLDSWSIWTKKIMVVTGKKGKDVFLPLRLSITGMASGPEMSVILPLLRREEIIKRLS
ncbi:MAG: glutamate--tRNA ligase [Candidatus Tisiphia sp.]|uniref:glutamate--tRNA ligase n=1 Tax=Candidatus Tisiphia endosymbiont of Melanophora roralis TaxID=3066261 RepID=UPI001E78074B|nr:MAG: glutamate--tRNA ligase [Rickettsia endosymbiont of Cimex lectularius]